MKEELLEKEQTESTVPTTQQSEPMGVLEDENGNQFEVPLKELIDYFENGIPITSPLVPCVQNSQ